MRGEEGDKGGLSVKAECVVVQIDRMKLRQCKKRSEE